MSNRITPDGNRWRVDFKEGGTAWYNTKEQAEAIKAKRDAEDAFTKAMWDGILADKPHLMPNRGSE
jgi:hypothetical protein